MSEIESLALKLCLSGLSSAIAEAATFPFDLTKTRLQIQGEMAASSSQLVAKRGMVGTAWHVVTTEGITKLWSGLPPAVFRQIIYTGLRMPLYEQLREKVFKRNTDGSFSVWKAIAAGSSAGAISQLVTSPLDLAKVKMQTRNARVTRINTATSRIDTNLFCLLHSIYQKRGVQGLWAGCVPSVHRAALVNIGNLATYDVAKQTILKRTPLEDDWRCHMAASSCSGFVAAALSTPADVIKTRIMNQRGDLKGSSKLYKSSFDCLVKTIANEGPMSLYKGFIPIWSRIAPWSMIFWITNEEFRVVIGMKGF